MWIRMLGLKVIKSKVIGVENESLNMNVWMNEIQNVGVRIFEQTVDI